MRQFPERAFSLAACIREACKSSRSNKLLRGIISARNNALQGFWIVWDGCLKHFYQDLCSISYKVRAKLDKQSLLPYRLELLRVVQVVSEQVGTLDRTMDFNKTLDQLVYAVGGIRGGNFLIAKDGSVLQTEHHDCSSH